MNTNVNLEAGLGVLGFLVAGFVLLSLGLVFVYALWRRDGWLGRVSATGVVGVLALYVWLLAAFSLSSSEKALARGEEKYFCEIDCHLAYSVAGVRRAKTLGEQPSLKVAANGEFYVVTVRTRFDEDTISPQRARDVALAPNPRSLTVFDGRGGTHEISVAGQRALEASAAGAGHPLTTPLKPGESYTTDLVFDLPAGAGQPVLLLNESIIPTRFIIGHENSPLHKKTKFRLEGHAG